MFGELVGLWAAAAWQAMGSPGLRPAGRTRPRTRHDAARHAARRQRPAGLPGRHRRRIWSRPARCCAAARRRRCATPACRLPGTRIQRRAGRADDRARQRVLRCAADPPGRHDERRLARARWSRSTRRAGWRSRPLRSHSFPPTWHHRPSSMRPPAPIREWRPDGPARDIARRIMDGCGVGLVIDYGYAEHGIGDTLQAVRGHRFVDPLDAPGEADLTAHVDFAALGRALAGAGAGVQGPVTQAAFLNTLGIGAAGRGAAARRARSRRRDRRRRGPADCAADVAAWDHVQGAGLRASFHRPAAGPRGEPAVIKNGGRQPPFLQHVDPDHGQG